MKRNEPKGSKAFRWMITGILILTAVVLMLPLYYLVVTSFKTMQEAIGPFHWWPQTRTLNNFREVFQMEQFHIVRFFFNTIFLILVKSLGTIFTCSLAAYGFARYQFKYKELIFGILMCALMIPGELLTIPCYEVYINLGWMDSYLPMTVSKFFGTDIFAIFLLRQFFAKVPGSLFEAAKIDGCGEFQMFRSIMVPLSKPVFVTLFLLYFVGTYNDVYEANLYLLSENKYTLAQGLQMVENLFNNGGHDYLIPWNVLSAATLVAIVPVIILFAFGQKQFIEGMATSGIKG